MSIKTLQRRFHPDFSSPRKKPLGPVEVNWAHPLARGLISFPLINEYGLTKFKDVADPSITYDYIHPVPTWTSLDGHPCVELNWNGGGEDRIDSSRPLLPASGDFSVTLVFYLRFNTTTSKILGQYQSGVSGRTYWTLGKPGDPTVSMFAGHVSISFELGTSPKEEEWNQLTLYRRSGFFGGVLNGIASATEVFDDVLIPQNIPLQLFGTQLSGVIRGAASHAIVHNRYLTFGETVALQKDNFAMLQPKSPVIPYKFLSPTGPVTPINLGTTNLLATSARLTWEQG